MLKYLTNYTQILYPYTYLFKVIDTAQSCKYQYLHTTMGHGTVDVVRQKVELFRISMKECIREVLQSPVKTGGKMCYCNY